MVLCLIYRIDKLFELKRADECLKKYNQKQKDKQNINYKKKFKNFVLFIKNEVYPTPNVLNFTKVTSIESKENSPYIILHTKSDYPALPDENKEIIEKSFKYNLSNNSELDEINYILDYVGVNSFRELQNKKIPTIYKSEKKFGYKTNTVSYDIHSPNKTISSRILYRIERLCLRLKCMGRKSQLWGEDEYGAYAPNRNLCLITVLILAPLSFISAHIYIFSVLFAICFYIFPLLFGFTVGLYELTSEMPEDREYIQHRLSK